MVALKLKSDDSVASGGRMVSVPESTIKAYEARIRELESQALTDSLTSLGNRRYFDDTLLRIKSGIRREEEYGTRRAEMACVYFDLDKFKEVNDTQGHDAGDVLLKKFAEILISNSRGSDQAFRLGGDEFVVLLHGKGREDAQVYAKRVAKDVAVVAGLEASAGIYTLREAGEDVDVMIKTSDGILRAFKDERR